MQPLSLEETFTFSCSPAVSCFNQCCRDLNQFLTPYDILRLKQHLDMSSDVFLTRYTTVYDGPRTGLPVVSLKPQDDGRGRCPFVTPEGCSVYKDRPSSCRTYPLARAVTRSRETGRRREHYALLREPHCRGHGEGRRWTVRDWIEDQGLGEYYRFNDLFLGIIGVKNRLRPGPLDVTEKRLFCMAVYDLDDFRIQITQKDLPGPDTATLNRLAADEIALLEFGHQWIRDVVLGRRIGPQGARGHESGK